MRKQLDFACWRTYCCLVCSTSAQSSTSCCCCCCVDSASQTAARLRNCNRLEQRSAYMGLIPFIFNLLQQQQNNNAQLRHGCLRFNRILRSLFFSQSVLFLRYSFFPMISFVFLNFSLHSALKS